jgi:hypothetical protein
MAASLLIVALVLVWPIRQVLLFGFFDPESQRISTAGDVKRLTHPYYLGALCNTVLVGVGGMVGACLLGVPLAYCTARYVVKGRGVITTLAVMALVSPPFIGAYSWIVVLGNNGWLTVQMKALGIALPTIYGMAGIILGSFETDSSESQGFHLEPLRIARQGHIERRDAPGAGLLGAGQVQRIPGAQGTVGIEHHHGSPVEGRRFDGNEFEIVRDQSAEALPRARSLPGVELLGALLETQGAGEFRHTPSG